MKITFTRQALKDLARIKCVPSLSKKVFKLLQILEENPFQPPYEKLVGDADGLYSRRINLQHRLVYAVHEAEVKVVAMWTHYETLQ